MRIDQIALAIQPDHGATIGDLKEGDPRKAVAPHLASGNANVRTTAVSYYYQYGTKADLPTLEPLQSDGTKAPVCDEDPDCRSALVPYW